MLSGVFVICFSTRTNIRSRATSVHSHGADIVVAAVLMLPTIRFLEKPRGQDVRLNTGEHHGTSLTISFLYFPRWQSNKRGDIPFYRLLAKEL